MKTTDKNEQIQISLCRSSRGVSMTATLIVAVLESFMLGYTLINPDFYGEYIHRYRSFYIFLLAVALAYLAVWLYVRKNIGRRHKVMSVSNPLCAILFYAWSLAITYSDYTVTGVVDPTVFMTFSMVAPLGFYMSPMLYGMIVGAADALMVTLILGTNSIGAIINSSVFFIFQIVLGINYLRMKINAAMRIVEEQENALIDVLTNCPNRRAYEAEMDKLKEGALPEDLAYIAVDLNALKEANDTCGHEVGDKLIAGTARCIEKSVGDKGQAFRIGGDEFAMIVHASASETEDICASINANTEEWSKENDLSLSISYGCACSFELANGNTVIDLARMADGRMYRAKADYYQRFGKDRRKYFSDAPTEPDSAN